MAIDHGIINTPLAKRGGGSIDQQIDRYKRDQAKKLMEERRAAAIAHRELRDKAKEAVETLTDDQISTLAMKGGKTIKSTRRWLMAQTKWQPGTILKYVDELLRKEQ